MSTYTQARGTTSKFSITYWLWALGDIEIINAIATAYARGNERSRTRLAFLLVVTGFLTAIFGVATWKFDVEPSKIFVFEVAHRVSPNLDTAAAIVGWSLLILSLLPNLLEFGAAGLAVRGSIVVEVLIVVSMLFDMGTDAPNAEYWANVLLDVMLSHYPGLPGWMDVLIKWLATVPMLFIFTVGIEIAFLTFAISFWRLLLAYFVADSVYRSERDARRSAAKSRNKRKPSSAPHRRGARGGAYDGSAYGQAVPPASEFAEAEVHTF